MLRQRIPSQGRHATPIDVVHGHIIETCIATETYENDQVATRDYIVEIDGRIVACMELDRDGWDRWAWEMHWRIRKQFRRDQQRANSPRRRRIKALVGPLFEQISSDRSKT